ncbi:MAG: hypothetical protein VKO21_05485 [Candidatus Sericytochromatia bacterium]|nr:hypothetical protein [Candidatus Sericytochromatia bacterium]
MTADEMRGEESAEAGRKEADAFPPIRRAVFDLEWKVRREASQTAERVAELLQEVLQTTAWGAAAMADGLQPVLIELRDRLTALEELAHGPDGLARETVQRLGARIDAAESLAEAALGQRAEIEEDFAQTLSPLQEEAERTREDRLTLAEVVEALVRVEDPAEGVPALREAVATLHEDNLRREELVQTLAREMADRVRSMEETLAAWVTTLQGAKDVLVTLPDRLEQLAGFAGRLDAMEQSEMQRQQTEKLRQQAVTELGQHVEEVREDVGQRLAGLADLTGSLREELDDTVRAGQLAALTAGLGQQQLGLKELRDTFQTWRLAQEALQSATHSTSGLYENLEQLREESRQQVSRLAKRLEAIERHLAQGSKVGSPVPPTSTSPPPRSTTPRTPAGREGRPPSQEVDPPRGAREG